jgi:hypothetical protein
LHADPLKFFSSVVVPGSWRTWGAGTTVSGVYPFSRAAAATMTLKIDPGE